MVRPRGTECLVAVACEVQRRIIGRTGFLGEPSRQGSLAVHPSTIGIICIGLKPVGVDGIASAFLFADGLHFCERHVVSHARLSRRRLRMVVVGGLERHDEVRLRRYRYRKRRLGNGHGFVGNCRCLSLAVMKRLVALRLPGFRRNEVEVDGASRQVDEAYRIVLRRRSSERCLHFVTLSVFDCQVAGLVVGAVGPSGIVGLQLQSTHVERQLGLIADRYLELAHVTVFRAAGIAIGLDDVGSGFQVIEDVGIRSVGLLLCRRVVAYGFTRRLLRQLHAVGTSVHFHRHLGGKTIAPEACQEQCDDADILFHFLRVFLLLNDDFFAVHNP